MKHLLSQQASLKLSSYQKLCPTPRALCSGPIASKPRTKYGVSTRLTASASPAASSEGDYQSRATLSAQQWDLLTDRMVASSSIPFSILVVPQVVQNMVSMSSGNVAALSIISWEGYLSGLLGNLLMCTHFAGRHERSAVTVQLVGIINNVVVLSQVAFASFMPLAVFIPSMAMTALAVGVNLTQLRKGSGSSPDVETVDSFWGRWQLFAGICGMAVVPQVMSNLLLPGTLGLLPGIATLLLLLVYFGSQMADAAKKQSLGRVAAQLPGWAATLFFALSPLPQLVRNFLEPQCLEGLSLGTMLLALLGNVLMVPRALFTKDAAWIAGSSWGTTAGWGQLLSLYLGTSAVTGQRYISLAAFAAVTLALLSFVAFILTKNSRATGNDATM